MVLGAILAFAMEVTTRHQRQHSGDHPSAHRPGCGAVLAAVRDQPVSLESAQILRPPPQVVEERPVRVVEERPVEVVEERRLDDGLP
jgi:hypothetical protein